MLIVKNGQTKFGSPSSNSVLPVVHIQDLSSEDEGVDVEAYELFECMKGLASIMSKSNSLGRSLVDVSLLVEVEAGIFALVYSCFDGGHIFYTI